MSPRKGSQMDLAICSNDPAVVDVVSRVFRGEDNRQMVCESGLEVLGLIGVLHCDLLVLDLETPGLGGLLLISAVKELAPALPILAVSTKDGVDARSFSQKGVPYARIGPGANSDGAAVRSELARLKVGVESSAGQTR
jgi:CheY-like chemotaxis protein